MKFLKTSLKSKGKLLLPILLAFVLATAGIIAGVQVHDVNLNDVLTVGQGQKVITIGTEAYAVGTADYTCDGVADDVQFQAALDALPATGGKIIALTGNYAFTATVTRAIDDVIIEGNGRGTSFTNDGITAIFSMGLQSHWQFRNFQTDAGGVNVAAGSGWVMEGVNIIGLGAFTYRTDTNAQQFEVPTGRGATLVVAASDASDASKAQADYICDGIADDVQIQAALDALPASGGVVQLTEGNFYLAASVNILEDDICLFGVGWATRLLPTADFSQLIQAGGNAGDTLVEGVIIRDLELDGQKASRAITQAINGKGLTRLLLENIYIHDVSGDGIKLDSDGVYSTYVPRINKCWIHNIDSVAIRLSNTAGIHEGDIVTNCNIEGIVSAAIRFDGGYGVFSDNIINNTCTTPGGGDAPAAITAYGSKVAVTGGQILASNCSAISFRGGGNNSVVGVQFTDCSLAANNTYDWIVLMNQNDEGTTIEGNTFRVESANKARYFIYSYDSARTTIQGNTFESGMTVTGIIAPILTNDPVSGLLVDVLPNIVRGNTGYIAPGEVRTASGSLAAGVANAICFAWHNPEAQDILIKKVVIEVTTAGGTPGSHLDVGIADDAAGTNRGTEFFDDLLLNTVQIDDSWVAGDGGTQTKWVFCQDSASGTDGWVVGQILDANAASLVGKYYIEYVGR